MLNFINELFNEHPEKNNMTYFNHCLHSLKLSYYFASASCKAFIHSLFPFLYETSSTEYLDTLNDILGKNKMI